ncbi:MAG: HDOD domain-containing protein [Spirochaetota bacterium]
MRLSKIKKTMERVKELPTLSVVANKVNAVLNDPTSSTSDLAKIIECDQSITAKILALANSSQYSLPQRVTNISQAISLLGYKNVSYIVMTISVFDALRNKKSAFDRTRFWMHSIAVAIMSMKISKECMYTFKEDVFTAGLLHDIGKVFMDGYLHEEFREVLNTANKNNISFFEAENMLYDVNHTMIGEWIARTWKLPIHVIATIKHHHQEPQHRQGLSVSTDVSVDYIRTADVAVRVIGIGSNGDGKSYKPQLGSELFTRLPLDFEDVIGLSKQLEDEIKKSQTLLSLAVEG